MRSRDILPEMRFGKLTAIRKLKARGRGQHVQWLCECDCGKLHEARGACLADGTTIQCPNCRAAEAVRTKRGESPVPDVIHTAGAMNDSDLTLRIAGVYQIAIEESCPRVAKELNEIILSCM